MHQYHAKSILACTLPFSPSLSRSVSDLIPFSSEMRASMRCFLPCLTANDKDLGHPNTLAVENISHMWQRPINAFAHFGTKTIDSGPEPTNPLKLISSPISLAVRKQV